MKIRFFEKQAWIIFLIIGVMILAGAVPHMLGTNTDPALVKTISGLSIDELRADNESFFALYDFYFRSSGLSDLGFAVLLIFIAATAYRRGQKWAWFAFLIVPVWFFSWILLSMTLPAESGSLLYPPLTVLVIFSLAGLILPVRVFFGSLKAGS